MSAAAIIATLRAAGAELRIEDDKVRVRPKGPIAPELLARARAHRDAIRALLEGTVEAALDAEDVAVEAEERAAIQAEAALPMVPEAEHARMVAGLMRVAHLRPPRFAAPARWWSEERVAVCTGCGTASTWRPDPPAGPSPTVLRWRCTRCCP